MKKLVLLLSLMGVSSFTLADDKKPWAVDVDVGAIATTGNTETTSIQTKVDAKQYLKKWENQYILSGLFKEDEVVGVDEKKTKEKTAEKYFGSAKFAYLIGIEKSYFFTYLSHTTDYFSAYRTYNTLSMGYGDWIYSGDRFSWFVEAGPGYFEGKKVVEAESLALAPVYQDENGFMLRVASAIEWKVSDSATFKQTVSVEGGADNKRTQSETTLTTSITKSMKMKVGFALAHDSDVAQDKEKLDTTTFVNLVYSF